MQRFLSYENTILAVVIMVSFINPFYQQRPDNSPAWHRHGLWCD